MSTGRRKMLIIVICSALLLGATAAIVLGHLTLTDPVVDADINAHFNTLLATEPPATATRPLADENTAAEKSATRNRRKDRHLPQTSTQAKHHRRGLKSISADRTPAIDGIECVAEGTCLIDRELFLTAAKSPSAHIGNTNAAPIRRGDALEGFRLIGVSGGYLNALGLRDGDELMAINGYPLDSAQNVSRAMAAVLQASQFRLDIRRGGRPASFYYRLK